MTEEYGHIPDGFFLSQKEVEELRNAKKELTDYGKKRLKEMSEKKIIWTSILDERYECKVVRNSHYSGQLRVFDNREKKYLCDEEVRLSYGATFGPDAVDVVEWQDKILEIVDGN
jgi:hypothetical protein